MDRRTQSREQLGELLVHSELVYAGQGYCFALARFGEERDAEILTAYLDRWLRETSCRYNQWGLCCTWTSCTRQSAQLASSSLVACERARPWRA